MIMSGPNDEEPRLFEELTPLSLSLVSALFNDMEITDLHPSVKTKISRAIISITDDFVSILIVVCGYAMKLDIGLDEVIYATKCLWRKAQLHFDILAEETMAEELYLGHSIEDASENDDDNDSDYSEDTETVDDDESDASESSSASEADRESISDEDDDFSTIDSELNIDVSFESEDNIHSSEDASQAQTDFVSQFITYFNRISQSKFKTEFSLRRPAASAFAAFLSKQVKLSLESNSDSFFIRAGFPAFGILNPLYCTQDQCSQLKSAQVIPSQSILPSVEDSRTKRLPPSITSVVRNLNAENYMTTSRGIADSRQDNIENMMPPRLATPSHSKGTHDEGLSRFSTSRFSEDEPEIIETLKTALKSERESNFYLRLRHEELKLVLARLNTLVYGDDAVSTQHNSAFSTTAKARPSDPYDSEDTEYEYGKPEESSAHRDSLQPSSSSAFANTSFSPPPQLLKKSLKRSHLETVAEQGASSSHSEIDAKSLRYSYDYEEDPEGVIGDLRHPSIQQQQQALNDENQPAGKRVRRSSSLSTRQQGPHTPTLFDRHL